jgi:hypothetical protein
MTTRRWTLKRFFLTGALSAATFAAAFVLGNAITLTLGPGTSGLVTIIVTTVLIVVCARLVETVGVLTVAVGLFTVFAIPTNLFGPPGPQKVLIGVLTGLSYDLVWNLSGRRKWSLPAAAAISTALSIVLIFGLMVLLDHPRKDYLRSILAFTVPLYAVLGVVGAVIGNRIYDKSLGRLAVVQQLQAD